MGNRSSRYIAMVAPDGTINSLVEQASAGVERGILPESPEGLSILTTGRDILYRFDDDRRLRDIPYPEVLQSMQQEVRLTLQKVGHGDLLDEPELIPLLRRLLVSLDATARAFQEACRHHGGEERGGQG